MPNEEPTLRDGNYTVVQVEREGHSMAKFGIFSGIKSVPHQVIEGDHLEQAGDVVKVMKYDVSYSAFHQVGAFHLDKDQTVREVQDKTS